MNSKERMLIALNKGVPDRLPATIHQWQPYHLKTFMGGISDIEAFREVGLDAAITYYPFYPVEANGWKVASKISVINGITTADYTVETPEGNLNYQTGTNEYTTWVTDHMIKKDEDIYLIKKYYPRYKLDKAAMIKKYDEIGEDGILRSFLPGYQGGCWQDACELYGTENLIYAAFDKPEWVHEFLEILLERKLQYIYEELKGSKVDLIETGGGASSSTVISPGIHKEFCLPYDTKMHNALHQVGHKVVYHTCGGMMGILDFIVENGCDASETLSPPGVGGNIQNPEIVKKAIGEKVSLIGGMDQFNVLTSGSIKDIVNEVYRLFETFGKKGGYIISACDHFFETPVENLRIYSEAARECSY
jgi:uroporphyrinogen-III decarboxylase